MGDVDNSFLPRRRAQIFLELHKKDPLAAVGWLLNNVPVEERSEIIKYFNEHTRLIKNEKRFMSFL